MRPQPPGVERVRGEHPSDPAWRADALAQSRHTRWADELRAPLADHDPERAEAICAAVTRAALRDLAPALMLLGTAERRRARALAAFTLTLFDFAGQPGLEGERLTQINRMEFDLESALAGEPPGQPVFVLMAATGPWAEAALDAIVACARRRVTQPRPASRREASDEALALGGALTEAFVGFRVAGVGLRAAGDDSQAAGAGSRGPGAAQLAAGLLRLAGLLGLAEDSRRHRERLPRTALPEDWMGGSRTSPDLARAIAQEGRAIAELFDRVDLGSLPPTERRAARYLLAAGRRLLDAAERRGAGLLEGPPALGAATRVYLLARSFFG